MYKLIKQPFGDQIVVKRIFDSAFISGGESGDFQQFKTDLRNGTELQDADGNVMTAEQVQEFLATLP